MARAREATLESLRNPGSVAVVGASGSGAKVGGRILANLLAGRYRGRVWPVNPRHARLLGRDCYPDLRALPEAPELAVLAVPAPAVPGVLREAAAAGVRVAVVTAGGFSESGEEGARLQAEIAEVAGPGRLRVVGPNCLGVLDARSGLDTFFVPAVGPGLPRPGPAAVLSQSGAFALALVERLSREGPGVSMALSFGNRADFGETEALDELADDDATGVVALVVESVRDGARFLAAAARCATRKPVVALKCGRDGSGAAAVRSHTGALAGRSAVYGAAFRRAGVVEARGLDDLLDATKALAMQPPAAGRRLLLVTNGGGLGAACADAAEDAGLRADALPAAAAGRLRGRLPGFASVRNPLDLTAAAGDEAFGAALEECLAAPDSAYDAAVVVCLGAAPALTVGVARRLGDAARRSGRPVAAMHVGGAGGLATDEALEAEGIPTFPTPERAIGAVRALVLRGEALGRLRRTRDGTGAAPAVEEAAR